MFSPVVLRERDRLVCPVHDARAPQRLRERALKQWDRVQQLLLGRRVLDGLEPVADHLARVQGKLAVQTEAAPAGAKDDDATGEDGPDNLRVVGGEIAESVERRQAVGLLPVALPLDVGQAEVATQLILGESSMPLWVAIQTRFGVHNPKRCALAATSP